MEHEKRPQYPVLAFSQGLVDSESSEEALTTCSSIALKHGYYRGMIIIDSAGRCFFVENATKLHGVGPFRGYNIFLNQTIRVALVFDEHRTEQMKTADVRAKVLDRMGPNSDWATRGDYEELTMRVRDAMTVREMIDLLAHWF